MMANLVNNRPGPSKTHPGIMMTGIPAGNLMAIWPKVEAMIAPALAEDETTSMVLTRLYRQEAQLWAIFDEGEPLAAVVTEIVGAGDAKLCNIWAAGGDGINRWLDFLPMIEEWADENGCRAVIVERGRRGFQRLLKGYRVTHVTLRKEL